MTTSIGRRAFVTALGGAAAALLRPPAARAQQPTKVWRVGFLSGVSRVAVSGLYAGFIQGMRELGYAKGSDFVIEWRSAEGNCARFPDLAAELVGLKVDIIVTGVTAAMRALQG